MAGVGQQRAEEARKLSHEKLVALDANSAHLDSENQFLKSENESLKAEKARLVELAGQGQVSITELKRDLDRISREPRPNVLASNRAEQAEIEERLKKTQDQLKLITEKVEAVKIDSMEREQLEARTPRCNDFNVIQRSRFRIPGLDYTLKIGDMTKRRVMTLEVLKGGTTRVGQVEEKIEERKELVVRDGDAELAITFLSIEAQNLIPGVREDSGVVKICTNLWSDGTGQ